MLSGVELGAERVQDSKAVAAGVAGVFHGHVFVGVAVFGRRETEVVGMGVVLVAVQLHEQQVDARISRSFCLRCWRQRA